MPLDEYSRALLQARRAANIPAITDQPIAEIRAARERLRQEIAGEIKVALPEVDDHEIPVSGGQILARIYRPSLNRDLPVAMYFHGGGWVLGDLEHSDDVCRWLARESGCVLVNVDYRLAPEHTFPTAAEDSYAATKWVLANAERLGVDADRLAVVGASAGGNLAAVVALLARDRGGPNVCAQVLVYPVLDAACTGGSYDEFADGFVVSAADMLWYWDQYVPDPADRDSRYACPLRAPDLRGLPPTLVITAENDPVRDDGERYADELAAAGVPTEQTRYEGTLHLFFGMPNATAKARAAIEQAGQFLRRHLATKESADGLAGLHASAGEWLDSKSAQIAELSDAIWRFAEPGLCETRSAAALAELLSAQGFEVIRGVAGLPTSFVARYGYSRPKIGLMCEYDATPGESQRPVPYPAAVPGAASGFTDLHNGIGAASVGAALAIRHAMAEHDVPGSVVVFGTPAEKLCIGKPFMAAAGLFENLDAVIAWHPRPYTTVEWDTGPGPYSADIFDFFGTSAYGAKPSAGVSALDAMTLMNVIVQFQREHLPPEHKITVNELVARGGDHPTSIPNHAQAWYVARAGDMAGLGVVSDALDRAAAAAAAALQARVTRRPVAATRPWLANHALACLCLRNLERVGAPRVPDGARELGRQILERLGRQANGAVFDETVSDPRAGLTAEFGGADDVTEFCWHAPTARIYVAYGLNSAPLPNWARAAFASTSAAHSTVLTAARAIAFSALELLTDPDARSAAWAEFEQRRAAAGDLHALLPADARPPVDEDSALPYMREHRLRALLAETADGAP